MDSGREHAEADRRWRASETQWPSGPLTFSVRRSCQDHWRWSWISPASIAPPTPSSPGRRRACTRPCRPSTAATSSTSRTVTWTPTRPRCSPPVRRAPAAPSTWPSAMGSRPCGSRTGSSGSATPAWAITPARCSASRSALLRTWPAFPASSGTARSSAPRSARARSSSAGPRPSCRSRSATRRRSGSIVPDPSPFARSRCWSGRFAMARTRTRRRGGSSGPGSPPRSGRSWTRRSP